MLSQLASMTGMKLYHYFPGKIPVIISIPHAGIYIPDEIFHRLAISARSLPDTDWHVERLYAFARQLGVHMLVATHSRYVVDVNRATDNQSLYPGKFTTCICPTTQFDGTNIYQQGEEPDAKEIQDRIALFWQPYHNKLQSIIDELKLAHQQIILFDAHSICSQVPMLFDGVLPDLNLGTADGYSINPTLAENLIRCCQQSPYSMVYNGRFKGGYITRHYGQPAQGVQAVQLELAQMNYMQETFPYHYVAEKAERLQQCLQGIINILVKECNG